MSKRKTPKFLTYEQKMELISEARKNLRRTACIFKVLGYYPKAVDIMLMIPFNTLEDIQVAVIRDEEKKRREQK